MRAGTAHSLCGGKNLFTTEYPLWSMLVAQALLYLVPFVSSYLALPAFAICVYRMIRYDARVFAVDYCMLIPVTQMFRAPGGMSLLVLYCLFGALWYFVRSGVPGNVAFGAFVVLVCYLLTRMQTAYDEFLKCLGQLFLLCVILPKQDGKSAEWAAKAFCISLLISSLYAFVFRGSWQLYALRGQEVPAYWGSSLRRFKGVFEDANYFMSLQIVGIAILIKLKYCGKIGTYVFAAGGVAMVYFGVLTYSKTFFFALILLVAVSIMFLWRGRKAFRIALLGVAMLIMILLLSLEKSPFAVVLARLTNATSFSEFTTGRSDLALLYFNAITEDLKSLVFGAGLGAEIFTLGTHNIFLEIAYHTGLLGLILFVGYGIALSMLMKEGRKACFAKNRMAAWVVLFMVVVLYCALHGMFSVISYAMFFLAYLSTMLMKEGCIANE